MIFIVRYFIITDKYLFTLFVYSVNEFEASKSVARSVNIDANINYSLKIPHKIRRNLQNINYPYRNILAEVLLRIPWRMFSSLEYL